MHLKAKNETDSIATRSQIAHRRLLAVLFVIGGFAHTSIALAGEFDTAVGCELRSEKKNGFLELTARRPRENCDQRPVSSGRQQAQRQR